VTYEIIVIILVVLIVGTIRRNGKRKNKVVVEGKGTNGNDTEE
jgi:hypothetical protein